MGHKYGLKMHRGVQVLMGKSRPPEKGKKGVTAQTGMKMAGPKTEVMMTLMVRLAMRQVWQMMTTPRKSLKSKMTNRTREKTLMSKEKRISHRKLEDHWTRQVMFRSRVPKRC